MCLRFRDEARYLSEWLDYHLAAGVDHFFLYNNFSEDGFLEALQPYLAQGLVTLIDWPRAPASPAAENDCLTRTAGRFGWVGFLDVDEFLVVADGRSIGSFLKEFSQAPAVALHWYMFGSNGHRTRPATGVIAAYTRRAPAPNHHVKVFVRPDQAVRNRNSHSFYYRRARCAVRENGSPVYGSMADPPTAERAWINHYHYKSLEDYLEKASRSSTLDASGTREPSRSVSGARRSHAEANDVVDERALQYLKYRQAVSQT